MNNTSCMARIGCGTMMLGVVSTLLAIATKLGHWNPLGLEAHCFAEGAGLMLLLSIAAHSCAACCFGACSAEKTAKP